MMEFHRKGRISSQLKIKFLMKSPTRSPKSKIFDFLVNRAKPYKIESSAPLDAPNSPAHSIYTASDRLDPELRQDLHETR